MFLQLLSPVNDQYRALRSKLGLLCILTAIALMSLSCEQRVNHHSGSGSQSPASISTPIPNNVAAILPTPTSTSLSGSRWSVLKSEVNWGQLSRFSPLELLQRFPLSMDRSEVAFIDHGEDFLKSRYNLLQNAKRSVRVQVFIFRADEVGAFFVQQLIALVKRGIQVSVIVDPVINYEPKDRHMLFDLLRNGVQVRGYEPGYKDYLAAIGHPDQILSKAVDAQYRFHEKLFIVDGDDPQNGVVMIGGVNFSNEYYDIPGEIPTKRWVDRDVALRGEIVSSMARSFDMNFQEMTQLYHPTLESNPVSDFITLGSLLFSFFDSDPFKPKEALADQVNAIAAKPYLFNWENTHHIRYIQSRPRFGEDHIFPAYIRSIDEAQTEILLNNSYLLPEENFLLAIRRAVMRGVQVKILTNTKGLTDVPSQVELARQRYKYMLDTNTLPNAKGKVEIAEWGGDPVMKNGLGLNHSKFAVFDRQMVIVGSYNLDPRSHNLNSESVVTFAPGTQTMQKFVDEFTNEFSPGFATPVTPEKAAEYRAAVDKNDPFTQLYERLLAGLL